MRGLFAALGALLLAAAAPAPDLVLQGIVTAADHQTYVERPFDVPTGVESVSLKLDYASEQRTVIDLGLTGTDGLVGWSGGFRRAVTVGPWAATPGYRAVPVAGRTLTLLLGVPNARAGTTTPWAVEVRFHRAGELPPGPVLSEGRRWFRGDLHSHTSHSDASCPDTAGERGPCPMARSAEAARAAGLDFVAITDHNSTTGMSELVALQEGEAGLLLMPGQEMTSFFGHALVLGPMAPAPFRVTEATPDAGLRWSRQTGALGGVVVLAHPALPSGEDCMGCGWTLPGLDWAHVHAVEVVNGGAVAFARGEVETVLSGIPWWHARLNEGRRLVGVAGSDSHDASLRPPDPRAIGSLRTVVEADGLSTAGLLDGLKAGRVFVEIGGPGNRMLDLRARAGAATAAMGGTLRLASPARVTFEASVEGCADCRIDWIVNGETLALDGGARQAVMARRSGWVRVDVREPDGRLALVGNPVWMVVERR